MKEKLNEKDELENYFLLNLSYIIIISYLCIIFVILFIKNITRKSLIYIGFFFIPKKESFVNCGTKERMTRPSPKLGIPIRGRPEKTCV